MSKIICSAAIRGAHKIVARAEKSLSEALEQYGPEKEVGLPNTGYFLPVIYAMTGMEVRKLRDMFPVLDRAKVLLPTLPSQHAWVPYLGLALDAGMATLWADEIIEAIKYIDDRCPYNIVEECPDRGPDFWLGAADDVILRKRGIEFVDGTAPGFAAIVGAAPTNEIAVRIARELQEKFLYVFMSATSDGRSMAEQLREEGVQLGWKTRLVPFGRDITATVFSLGFAARVAMSFGGVKPADFRRNLLYNKNRTFAFVIALGEVDDEKYAQAAGAINFGFPTIADTPIPEILPRGVCTYEHVVPNVPHDEIVARSIEVRGLKIVVTKMPVPVAYGPAFEGERIRREDLHVELGGPKAAACELTIIGDNVVDGKVTVLGPELDQIPPGASIHFGVLVEIGGRAMQEDFEPVLERQIHHFLGQAEGVQHMGQRDIVWMRIGRKAASQGLRFEHLGKLIHAQYHNQFGNIVDKVQVTIYTDREDVESLMGRARDLYRKRDERLANLTDESVDVFYSCTLCQSFAPNHVCILTPERPGLCGSESWLDGKAASQINPSGPNQPVPKGEVIDAERGKWSGVNQFVVNASHGGIEEFSAYSMLDAPMTSCGCFECISVVLPLTNGVMTVDRNYPEMTPCGMKFSTMAGLAGGGVQTPGMVGHSKFYMGSKKFLRADGGIRRLVWMPKALKEELRDLLQRAAEREGVPDLVDKIATEDDANAEDELLDFLRRVNHPVVEMEPLLA